MCKKHDKAMGSWRANSPLWPGIANPIQYLETGYTCAVVPYGQRKVCLQTEEGSIYVTRLFSQPRWQHVTIQ